MCGIAQGRFTHSLAPAADLAKFDLSQLPGQCRKPMIHCHPTRIAAATINCILACLLKVEGVLSQAAQDNRQHTLQSGFGHRVAANFRPSPRDRMRCNKKASRPSNRRAPLPFSDHLYFANLTASKLISERLQYRQPSKTRISSATSVKRSGWRGTMHSKGCGVDADPDADADSSACICSTACHASRMIASSPSRVLAAQTIRRWFFF